MLTLRLTPQEMERFTALGEAFDKADDIIEAALDALTDELQKGVDAYDAEEDREDGDPPADREALCLFLEEIEELDWVRDAIREYAGRLDILKRRWALSEVEAA
jgi:hypothetical protein